MQPPFKGSLRMVRLAFTYKCKYWTVGRYQVVLLSNGTNISRISSDRHEQTLRGARKLLSDWTSIPTVKDGGESLNIWSHRGQNGVGVLSEVVAMIQG